MKLNRTSTTTSKSRIEISLNDFTDDTDDTDNFNTSSETEAAEGFFQNIHSQDSESNTEFSLKTYPYNRNDLNTTIANNSVDTAPPNTMSYTFDSIINNLFENPEERMTNFRRTILIVYTAFEAYRTLISSYLIVFVPQNCGGYSCTIVQNLTPVNDLEVAAISLNTLMAFYFCTLFYLERERETTINLHLVADKKSPSDKEYLMNMIKSMDDLPRHKILKLNNWYRRCSQTILLVFFANVALSYFVIYKNYLNNTTITVFITNALFMISRIYKALKITSSGEYNIYSAYRTNPILYNRDRSSWLQNETVEFERYAENLAISF